MKKKHGVKRALALLLSTLLLTSSVGFSALAEEVLPAETVIEEVSTEIPDVDNAAAVEAAEPATAEQQAQEEVPAAAEQQVQEAAPAAEQPAQEEIPAAAEQQVQAEAPAAEQQPEEAEPEALQAEEVPAPETEALLADGEADVPPGAEYIVNGAPETEEELPTGYGAPEGADKDKYAVPLDEAESMFNSTSEAEEESLLSDDGIENPKTFVYYVDQNGVPQTEVECTKVTAELTEWTDGWYAVTKDVTTNGRIGVSGSNVNLILVDGATLTATNGINVGSGSGLTIWSQANDTGALTADASGIGQDRIAGIGGWQSDSGRITINGGVINASGSNWAPGIGSGLYNCGEITINRGTVTAKAGPLGAGIGTGAYGANGGTINITGGTINAIAGNHDDLGLRRVASIGCGGVSWNNGGIVRINLDYSDKTKENPIITGSGYHGVMTLAKPFYDKQEKKVYPAGRCEKLEFALNYPTVLVPADAYNVIIDESITNGTVTPSSNLALAGSSVTLTVTPDEDWSLENLTVKDAGGNEVTVTDGSFIMPASDVTVTAAFHDDSLIPYVDGRGVPQTPVKCIIVKEDITEWSDGWYAVTKDVTTNSRIGVIGSNVNLILVDGATLTATNGINVGSASGLTIWSQENDTGALTANAAGIDRDRIAGIGGWQSDSGRITINGGVINASGSNWAPGIGSGLYNCGEITINRGTVTAKAGPLGAGIGTGAYGANGGTINITGGTINAIAGDHDEMGNRRIASIGCGGLTWNNGGIVQINLDYSDKTKENPIITGTGYHGVLTLAKPFYDKQQQKVYPAGRCEKLEFALNYPTVLVPADAYNVIIDEGITNGTVTPSSNLALVGSTVTLTIKPDTDWSLETLTVTDAEGNEVPVAEDNSFVMPASDVTVTAAFHDDSLIPYVDGRGVPQTPVKCIIVKEDTTEWSDGWYAVTKDVTTNNRISVNGSDVNLILVDGVTLTATNGISVNSGVGLTIWSQENDTGALTANAGSMAECVTGIGGYQTDSGRITINGGNINAAGAYGAAGIGSGSYNCGEITINRGTVTAKGGYLGAGIGTSMYGASSGTITITGGTINAIAGNEGSGGTVRVASIGCGGLAWNGGGRVRIVLDYYDKTEENPIITSTGYHGMLTMNKPFFDKQNNKLYEAGRREDLEYALNFTTVLVPADLYKVIVDENIVNGTVTADPSIAKEGTTITLTITPDENYSLDTLVVKDMEGNEIQIADDNTFVMPASDVTVSAVFAEGILIPYVDARGVAQEPVRCIIVKEDVMEWDAGKWYAVTSDVTTKRRISVNGMGVNLILCDGATLTATNGISVNGGRELTIWQQEAGTGALIADASVNTKNGIAGIGGWQTQFGTITINGGHITAIGGRYAAGIGVGDGSFTSGIININNGDIHAVGGYDSPAIGGSRLSGCSQVNITGGRIVAEGKGRAASIGYGPEAKKLGHDYAKITLTYDTPDQDMSVTAASYLGSVTLEKRFIDTNYDYVLPTGKITDLEDLEDSVLVPCKGFIITEEQSEGGEIASDKHMVEAGESFTITLTPNPDYICDELILSWGEGFSHSVPNPGAETTFNIDEFNADVTVTAIWRLPAPAFRTHSLLLTGEIGVNFFMELPENDGVDYSDSYMEFRIPGRSARTTTDSLDDTDMDQSGRGYYGFTCNVSSIEMAQPITAVFHYGDGQTVESTYSVRDYIIAFEAVQDQYDAATTELVHALADYGHYAQITLSRANKWTIGKDYGNMDVYYNVYTDYSEMLAAVSGYGIVRETGDSDIQKISFTLNLLSRTEVYLYFTPKAGYKGNVSATIGEEAINVEKLSDGRYRITVENISAHELSEAHTVIMKTDSGNATVIVSPLSYIYAVLNAGPSNKDFDAMCAFYRYYKTAVDYRQAHGY